MIKLNETHINVWKVNQQCKVEVEKPHEENEKWRWSHERCVVILNGTLSSNNPFVSCVEKYDNERRMALYKQCMEESCRLVERLSMKSIVFRLLLAVESILMIVLVFVRGLFRYLNSVVKKVIQLNHGEMMNSVVCDRHSVHSYK